MSISNPTIVSDIPSVTEFIDKYAAERLEFEVVDKPSDNERIIYDGPNNSFIVMPNEYEGLEGNVKNYIVIPRVNFAEESLFLYFTNNPALNRFVMNVYEIRKLESDSNQRDMFIEWLQDALSTMSLNNDILNNVLTQIYSIYYMSEKGNWNQIVNSKVGESLTRIKELSNADPRVAQYKN